ncbi:DUF4932 domain-containing protein [Mucilaginibacter terrae]|uniref:DUF4932 domain-containing protein n=1 Tax=Mucilaginibacter terrae TaxID=1955052 RepID=A0ABU3H0H1_9SPHI|nr:DUF4932 domain-containing protein [Mucilaginibacter terrae]MDT3405507.1 hypothetical protein [Mucilaginibacter terrae]
MKHQTHLTCAIALFAATLTLNSCKSYDVTPRYTEKYITVNTGKIEAVAPESYELGLALLALTDAAKRDSSLIDTSTPYYKDFTAYFNKYKDHKAVLQLNAGLGSSRKLIEKYRNGLFAFKLVNGRFALKENYRIDNSKIQFKRYAGLLEDFYRDSKFEKFYADHQGTYKQLVQKAENYVSFENLKTTVNKDAKSFHVLVSPLMKGFPGIMDIKSEAFSETVIFPYLAPNGLIYQSK